jgi:hypothetical protein
MIGQEEWDLTFSEGLTLLTFFWISAQHKQSWHGFVPPLETSEVEVEFPRAPNPQ